MTFHMDRKEFDEWVEEGAFDRIWSAYEYAVNGGETTEIERLRAHVEELEKWLEMAQSSVPIGCALDEKITEVLKELTVVTTEKHEALMASCEDRTVLLEALRTIKASTSVEWIHTIINEALIGKR